MLLQQDSNYCHFVRFFRCKKFSTNELIKNMFFQLDWMVFVVVSRVFHVHPLFLHCLCSTAFSIFIQNPLKAADIECDWQIPILRINRATRNIENYSTHTQKIMDHLKQMRENMRQSISLPITFCIESEEIHAFSMRILFNFGK